MQSMGAPCSASHDWMFLVHVVLTAMNAALATFLAYRRVRKDKHDDRRWLRNSAEHERNRRDGCDAL